MTTLFDQLSDERTLREAWRKIHKNPRSSGIDQITIDEFRDKLETELYEIVDMLHSGKYKPQLLKAHPLEKGKNHSVESDNKEYRILKIPTVRDRVVQKAIEQLIEPILSKKYNLYNKVSFAYMEGGSVEKAALQIRDYYTEGNAWVYKSDIKKFFDKINKKAILEMIRDALPDDSLMVLIEKFLTIDIKNSQELVERTQQEYSYNPLVGVAQGSPLSPLFANVYLSSLDQLAIDSKLNMVRYADDLVVLTKTKEGASAAHNTIEKHLKSLQLEVHPLEVYGENVSSGHEKHSTVSKYSGLIFLGLNFKGSKIFPSGDSYVNAIWTVRRAANNKTLPFVKKLISIEARVQGWCSAYAFTDFQEQQVNKLNKQFEDVMQKVLRKSDLMAIHNKSALEALQLPTYKNRLNSIKDKRKNKKKIK